MTVTNRRDTDRRDTDRRGTARRDALDPDTLAALEEQRDFLLRSLEDLEREHDAGDVDDHDYRELKDDYTARAAAVLRAIEQRRSAIATAAPKRGRASTVLIVAAVVALLVVAGVAVAAMSGERRPGEEITGNTRESVIADLALAREQFARAINASSGDEKVEAYMQASDAYRRVLDQQPDNAEALTYRGWLVHNLALEAAATLPDQAIELDREALSLLSAAVEADPDYADARIFRAIVLEDAGRPAEALADLDALEAGSVPPGMQAMVDGLRARLEASVSAGAGSGP